jgi:uncharacterized protein DUF5670
MGGTGFRQRSNDKVLSYAKTTLTLLEWYGRISQSRGSIIRERQIWNLEKLQHLFKLIKRNEKLQIMLWTIVIILIVLWALGLGIHIGGGLIHLLLVLAVIMIVVNLIRRRAG